MTNDKYVNDQIIKIQADLKNNNLAQAGMEYEAALLHIKSIFSKHKRKGNKVFHLPAKFSTISEQARNKVN